MSLLLVGLNFKTAPLELREAVYFTEETLPVVYKTLRRQKISIVLLSTCNRTELYSVYERGPDDLDESQVKIEQLLTFLAEHHRVPLRQLRSSVYRLFGAEAISHLFKVAAGLDSMVIGENQVLSQLKRAYQVALQSRTTSTYLNKVFQRAFTCGKRVRTQTSIGAGGMSLGSVSIDLVRRLYQKEAAFSVCLVGAGEIAKEILTCLARYGRAAVTICNRNQKKAEALVRELLQKRAGENKQPFQSIETRPFKALYETVAQAEIVLTSTAATKPLITKAGLQAVAQRLGKRQNFTFFIDLSVPRNIAPEVNHLEDVVLYTIDDLEKVVLKNEIARKRESQEALAIINRQVEEFSKWEWKQTFLPLLKSLSQAGREKFLSSQPAFKKKRSQLKKMQ